MVKEIDISVVIPIYKNEGSLQELNDRLLKHLANYKYEIIYVNDASPDFSLKILKLLSSLNKKVHYIDLPYNIGQQKATIEGLKNAKGKRIVVLDADLQDRPELIVDLDLLYVKDGQSVFVWRKGVYQEYGRMLTSTSIKLLIQLFSGLSYRAGSYFLIDNLTLTKVLMMEKFCKYSHVSILVASCSKQVSYLEAKREKSEFGSGYNFRSRLRAAYRAIICSLQCKYIKLKHFQKVSFLRE